MYNPAEVDGDGTAWGDEPSLGDVKYIAEPTQSARGSQVPDDDRGTLT